MQVSFGDGLPSLMCEMCCQSLKNAFSFKKQCETVDSSLREYCKNLKVNAIKQELQNSEFMGKYINTLPVVPSIQLNQLLESLNTLSNLLSSNNSTPQEPTKVAPKEDVAPSNPIEINEDAPSLSTEINDKPNLHPETDYIQFLDNNQMLLTCRECAKMFTTLEGLRYSSF